jgi:glutamine cyclotransferase
VHEGYIANGKFYYTSHEKKGLGSIDLNGDDPEEIPLPVMNETFFVKRITGFGDFLYVAAYYDGEGHIIRMHLKTHETTILANGFGAIWELCSDGKTLYVYDTKSPADKKGNITVIPLE